MLLGFSVLASFQVDPDKTDCSLSSQNPNPANSLEEQPVGYRFAGRYRSDPIETPASCVCHLGSLFVG